MGTNKDRITPFDKLTSDFSTIHSKRMNEIMVTSTDEEFSVLYHKLMEYVHPKLQRTEIIEDKKEQVITVVHVKSEDYKDNVV